MAMKTITIEIEVPEETVVVFCSAVDENGDELVEYDYQVG